MDNKQAQGLKTWAVKGEHGARVSARTGGHEKAQGWDTGVWAQSFLCVQLNTSRCAPMAGATWRPAETPASGEVRPDTKSHPIPSPSCSSLCLFSLFLPLTCFCLPQPNPPSSSISVFFFPYLSLPLGLHLHRSVSIFLGRAPQPHTSPIQPTPHRGPSPLLSVGVCL